MEKSHQCNPTFQVKPNDLDQTLANILAAQLDTQVSVFDPNDEDAPPIVASARSQPSDCHIDVTGDEATIALGLPAGGVAIWTTNSADSGRSSRHGHSVLALEKSRQENKQLNAEVDSLAAQVMSDFEELSLIRSLASSMELPSSGNQWTEFVLGSLTPLAEGVGAASIAGVFTDKDEKRTLDPIWSGEALLTKEQLDQLIDSYNDESCTQPVVRNHVIQSNQFPGVELDEFVLVQCRTAGRLHGWVLACNRTNQIENDVPWAQLGFTTVQAGLMETATNQLAAQLHNMRLLKQKEDLFTEVVRALVNAVEARDPYTCGHSERVASFARCLAICSGQSQKAVDRIYLTGLLHDVGKIAIPDGVLQKPGKLDDDERKVIETHTDAGWRILHELDALQEILPGVLYHHEHFNGKGYPDGLVGENIPIDGRILAVCDAFDAMTSDRPYRKGMSIGKASAILKDGSGSFWDPKLIDAFLTNIDKMEHIRVNHQPREQATRPTPINGVPLVMPLTDKSSELV